MVQDRGGGEGSSGVIERFAAQLGVGGEWAFAQLGCASGVAAEPQSEHRRSTHGLRSSRAGHELYLLESGELTRAHRFLFWVGGTAGYESSWQGNFFTDV